MHLPLKQKASGSYPLSPSNTSVLVAEWLCMVRGPDATEQGAQFPRQTPHNARASDVQGLAREITVLWLAEPSHSDDVAE